MFPPVELGDQIERRHHKDHFFNAYEWENSYYKKVSLKTWPEFLNTGATKIFWKSLGVAQSAQNANNGENCDYYVLMVRSFIFVVETKDTKGYHDSENNRIVYHRNPRTAITAFCVDDCRNQVDTRTDDSSV